MRSKQQSLNGRSHSLMVATFWPLMAILTSMASTTISRGMSSPNNTHREKVPRLSNQLLIEKVPPSCGTLLIAPNIGKIHRQAPINTRHFKTRHPVVGASPPANDVFRDTDPVPHHNKTEPLACGWATGPHVATAHESADIHNEPRLQQSPCPLQK